jgi:hypothetical protein
MKHIGLWIDHKKAVIVIAGKQGEDIQQIESGVGRHVHYRGASHPKSPYSAQYQQGEDQLDNKYAEHLKKFYDQVIACVRDAESVMIFGPGEAKFELHKRLSLMQPHLNIPVVEALDKITDRQFAAKVRGRLQV